MPKKSSIIKDTLILTCITLASGLLLGIVHEVTKEPIRQNALQENLLSYQKAFPEAKKLDITDELKAKIDARKEEISTRGSKYGNISLNEILMAKDNDGNHIGYVVSITTKDGYSGEIKLSVGITDDNKLTGMEITQSSESPGLGLKANEEPFKSQYVGKEASELTVVKGSPNEHQIDAISGATITSDAVTNAVNEAIESVKIIKGGNLSE